MKEPNVRYQNQGDYQLPCVTIVDEGTNFYLNLNTKMKSQIDFHPEVIESLESFSQAIQTQVFNEAKLFQYEFAKKETTVEDFTIALIGRTKAGKSTLRTVLTGSGKENIGCGAQRTTRINDSHSFELLYRALFFLLLCNLQLQ